MSTFKKIKGFFLLLVMMGSTVAFAQTPQTQQAPESTKVSDAELTKFANTLKKVQAKNQQAQQEMMTLIADKGLTVERFQELQQAAANPNSDIKATPEELTKQKEVMGEIEKMQPKLQKEMEAEITKSGLSIERYQQVAAVVQTDTDMQQKVQKILMAQQTGK